MSFERAVDAVVLGDSAGLRRMLAEDPSLVKQRSAREHHAALLHYMAANGVEGERQRTPSNAMEIAHILLEAGAEVDALMDVYGGRHATLPLLVSSVHPYRAGLQAALAELLIDYGASVDGVGAGAWTSPLMTALAFGYCESAEALVRRGAKVDRLAAAAGMGRTEAVLRMLPQAGTPERHRAMALAAQLGRVEALEILLDAGEDPNRFNPDGNHSHSTPLHQAALAGHLEAVKLLVARGADLEIRDLAYNGTPLEWAEHAHQVEAAAYLRSAVSPR